MIEFMRFFLISVLGVLLDIATAYALHLIFNVDLWFAACVGFLFASLFNYTLHKRWSFSLENKSFSAKRLINYFTLMVFILFIRIFVVKMIAEFFSDRYVILVLSSATVITFLVNYFVSKTFIFNQIMNESDTRS